MSLPPESANPQPQGNDVPTPGQPAQQQSAQQQPVQYAQQAPAAQAAQGQFPAQQQPVQYAQQAPAAQAAQGQFPAQQYGAPVAPAQPSPALEALKAQFTTLTLNFKSQNQASQQLATSLPLFWVFNFSIISLLAGLWAISLLNTASNLANSAVYYLFSYGLFSLTGGELFTTFLVVTAATFGTLALRAAGLMMALNGGDKKYPFSYAANVYAESNVALIPALLILWLLSLIPAPGIFLIVLILIFLFFMVCSLFLNIQAYVGMSRSTRFVGSPVMRYILTTTGVIVAAWIVWYVAYQIITSVLS
ncbi:MAG: hypothetical protein SPI83_00015 [Rothia sp. (in: high G+C Gram-positive bacteria)]|nr:hypothetical protein [Rothia sp. (in: high G+C Gram-positive bacteria)]